MLNRFDELDIVALLEEYMEFMYDDDKQKAKELIEKIDNNR